MIGKKAFAPCAITYSFFILYQGIVKSLRFVEAGISRLQQDYERRARQLVRLKKDVSLRIIIVFKKDTNLSVL